MDYMTFTEFCDKFVPDDIPDIENDLECPEKYKSFISQLIITISSKVDRLDFICLSFIQNELNHITSFEQYFKDCPEIPDGIFEQMSKELYNEQFNMLDVKRKKVVIALSVYTYIKII